MSIGHLYILFGEVSSQVFCPLFNCVVVFLVFSSVIIHNGVLCSRKKEGTPTLQNSMDGTGELYAKVVKFDNVL